MLKSATKLDLVYVHFFFVDVVGLSNPTISTKSQIKKIQVLQNSIKNCKTYKSTKGQKMYVLPTGDGMAIGFLDDSQLPIRLALELHKKLAQYNKGKIAKDIIQVRIGLHSGNVYIIEDIKGQKNLWGSGIILARRVMDFGDAGHILLTQRMAEDLREISYDYKKIIKPLQELIIKHGQKMMIYNVYDDKIGNSEIPKKAIEQISNLGLYKTQINTLYKSIIVQLKFVDPSSMLIHYTRIYEISNNSDDPIKEVLHGIATDVPKSLDDLHIKVYDEDQNEMKISRILVNYPYQKEFTTIFNKLVMKNETPKKYFLEYESEEPERFFENTFFVDTRYFRLEFEYDEKFNINPPTFYEVQNEADKIIKLDITPKIERIKNKIKIMWEKENPTIGQSFRISW